MQTYINLWVSRTAFDEIFNAEGASAIRGALLRSPTKSDNPVEIAHRPLTFESTLCHRLGCRHRLTVTRRRIP